MLTRSLAQHAGRSIEIVDIGLQDVVEQLGHGRDPAAIIDDQRRRDAHGKVRTIAILDANGTWIADTAVSHGALSSAADPSFAWHRDHDDPGLRVDAPRLMPTGATPVIPMSRRLSNPDGSFAGVVLALLAPEEFSTLYGTVTMGRQGTVALWTADARLLVRYPALPASADPTAAPRAAPHLFDDRTGWVRSVSPWDGVERFFAFEHIDTYPLIVSAAMSTEDALASWRNEAYREGAVVVAACAMLLMLVVVLEQHRARVRALERASREADRNYRLVTQHSSDLIVLRSRPWGNRVYVSPSSQAIVGWTPDELTAMPPLEFVHADDVGRVAVAFAALTQDRPTGVSVHRVWHKAGHVIWVEAALRLTPDGSLISAARDVTARRTAELALADSEARYRLLADNASDMITHMGLDGTRLFVSPGSRELLGYEPEELVGTSPRQMIHPDDAAGLNSTLAALVSGDMERAINVNRLRHKDGRWIWVEASLKALRDPDGQHSGFVAAIRNIMDRKLADEALRESEARYRLLADHSRDLIALKPTFGGPRAYVSPACSEVVGYDPEEFAALAAADYVHPDDIERVAAEFASLDARHSAITSVHRVRHKAGHWIWSEVDFRLTNPGRPDQSVIVRARDVTARREAEQALAASEARYRILAETTSDVITQLDMTLRRQYVSPSCRAVFGYEPEEMIGNLPSARIHPEDAAAVRALALRLAAGEIDSDRATATYRTLHKQGHWIWIETVMNLVRDEVTGAPSSLICALRDITERQRTARHLERAKLAAESAARAKADFVANMSHELRTPLTGIIGVHDLLRRDVGLSAPQRRLLDLAADSGRSLLAIVNDVLDFSKIDAGQLAIESVPFDLDDLLASCRALVDEQLSGKPVRVFIDCEPSQLGWFQGDPTRLRQILLNLLTNALKFTARGRIEIRARYAAGPQRLRIEIRDTGIGLPADHVGMLFDRFTQADSSTTRRYGGTGLGLAICKRLTELMDGRIGAQAGDGGGSTFWFEVPLLRHYTSEAAGAGAPNERTGTRRYTILLAEDNAVNAEIIAALLTSRGHAVSVVGDGVAAVQRALEPDAFDLVLMDLQMPVMDGLSATLAIREAEAEAGTPRRCIVGLTANALAEDAERCLAAGMDAHLAKPIDWRALAETMDRLMRPGGAKVVAARHPTPVLDDDTLQELSAMIGREKTTEMLFRFVEDLGIRLDGVESGGAARLSDHMHALVSTSGQLGFHELSALCAEVDGEAREGAGLDRLADLRHAATRATAAMRRSIFAKVA